MAEVTVNVDGQECRLREGRWLLWELLRLGIEIPHICAEPDADAPHASCRLCWVEVDGKLQTACTTRVAGGMNVKTRTQRVDEMVASGFALLMSMHRLDCRRCSANRRCPLQDIAKARKLPLRPKGLPVIVPDWPVDSSRPDLVIDPGKCVLCGKCVKVCNDEVKKGILAFVNRGLQTKIGTFDGRPLATQGCGSCTRCAEVCPVGAIYLVKDAPEAIAK
ncbi:MAG: ferredoxin [Deltaproteobacteria bacterium]|nr:MAG: ferredoxin [Deltaproteobacteria bacterium]